MPDTPTSEDRDLRYLNTRQAATVLQVSEGTVRRWLQRDMIRGVLLSDRAGWRIPRSEIDRLLLQPAVAVKTEGTKPEGQVRALDTLVREDKPIESMRIEGMLSHNRLIGFANVTPDNGDATLIDMLWGIATAKPNSTHRLRVTIEEIS